MKMENQKPNRLLRILRPTSPVIYISADDVTEIPADEITVDLVGEKAFGVLALPRLWTLPFVVVSDKLFDDYVSSAINRRPLLIDKWIQHISAAARGIGLRPNEDIIVRSSGCLESLDDRGRLWSDHGYLSDLGGPISRCLNELSNRAISASERIPLIIQKYLAAPSATGHLSNERRIYEEKRDWLGEFEDGATVKNSSFQINLRNWRKRIDVDKYTNSPLACNLSAHVSKILRIPATWVYIQNARCHFEWVWDGNTIFLVQADQEAIPRGINPTLKPRQASTKAASFIPQCLHEINEQHAARYDKVKNVFTYMNLGLPTAKLYILDDQAVIRDLAVAHVPADLENDVSHLVHDSLIIRMDIATDDKKKRQLLPRTEEHELSSALQWLIDKSKEFIATGFPEEVAFIFHNFVPATASAFAYAAPGERKVQIEALWGLPEGLYYNAHDKYVVDTQASSISQISKPSFTVEEDRNYKHSFISPDSDGRWTAKTLRPPYDWKGSIQKAEWVKDIALESRRIANAVGKPLSIMWFVDVSEECCPTRVFPWYHEVYDIAAVNRPHQTRKKNPLDETYTVSTNSDLSFLRAESEKPQSNIRCIKIQPRDDDLLRNRNALQEIGELTKKLNGVIMLEGGVLSHAYYQLVQTNAVVEIVHPFKASEGKIEFNKLVRDKIPSNIEQKGEAAGSTHSTGEYLLRLLREKLIEESFEVLDAVDQDAIIGELADVSEVIEGILSHIGISKAELDQIQRKKREQAGGFRDGTILIDTRNPLPTDKVDSVGDLFGGMDSERALLNAVTERPLFELDHNKIEKWSDKKQHPASVETIMRLSIPAARDNWTAQSSDSAIVANSSSKIHIKLTGTRVGSRQQIELSIFRPNKQLVLFEYESLKSG